jgi:hypothetical protein
MTNPNIRIKRSAIPGKRPSNSQMELGELALNTNDGRLFTKKENVGIGTTVTLLNVWTENVGGGAYYTDGNIGIGTTNAIKKFHILDDDCDIKIGDITEGTSTTDGGIIFSGLGTFTSALFTEVNGEILSYGINVGQIIGFETGRVGGIFRLDTRNPGAYGDSNCFVVKGRSIGTTIEHNSIVVNLNNGNTFLSPVKGVVIVGTSVTTGTASQRLQVTGGAYISDNTGIGTTNPTSKLTVQGDVLVSGVITSTDYNCSSDINLKENIQPIENPIDKVLNITGVSFDWKENGRSSMGVIAQEVERVLPELVSGSDSKTVNYNGLIGLLIEVVKEQQREINTLKEKIK